MNYTAKCGCEVEVEVGMDWTYGCAGSCCPPVEFAVVESVEILQPCITHYSG